MSCIFEYMYVSHFIQSVFTYIESIVVKRNDIIW